MDPAINGGCSSALDWIGKFAAFASAIAAIFSYCSSRTANSLAKYALTKKTQSELFTTILLEVADLLRLESANALTQQDREVLRKNPRYVEVGKQLQRLKALSPCFKRLIKDNEKASAFLANLADESTSIRVEVDQLEAIMSILQQAHRNELNDH
jgi:hypothetical protein